MRLKNQSDPSSDGRINLHAVLAGVLTAFVVSLLVATVLAFVITQTSVSETAILRSLTYLGVITLAVAGALGASWARENGWFHGALVGAFYVAVAVSATALFLEGAVDGYLLAERLLIGVLAGGIGGVLGVNL